MSERKGFIDAYLERELSMAALCRGFGISRKTGYKWVSRFKTHGYAGLDDQSRAPTHHPNQVAPEVEQMILACRGKHASWGPKKLLYVLNQEHRGVSWPVASTVGDLLRRHGLTVPRRRRRRSPPYTGPFQACTACNAVWCMDFKGWFRTGDGRRCEPLTVTDAHSRFLIRCQALERISTQWTQAWLEAAFRQFGLPMAIRTDNGTPFASRGLAGLSRLSVWLIRLGIVPERIEPGRPDQNGRHERFHRTLKEATANPPARTLRAQQRRFDAFGHEYNHVRPHEALDMTPPGSLYEPSPRRYPDRLQPVAYPSSMTRRKVMKHGELYWHGHAVFLGEAFYGQTVGLEPIDEGLWRIDLCTTPVGHLNERTMRVQPLSVGKASRDP